MKLLHVPKYGPGKGGMDALLALHRKSETVLPLLFQKDSDVRGVDISPTLPLCIQNNKWKQLATCSQAFDASLYYNCWGADLAANYDRSKIKAGYIHNHYPGFAEYIDYYKDYLDGFLTVNAATTDWLRNHLANTFPRESIQTVTLPITRPTIDFKDSEKQPIIGFSGRINVEQKRYDRLPDFLSRVHRCVPHMKVEVLGDGPYLSQLKERVRPFRNIRFIEWTRGEDYWKVIKRWRYIAFLSDYEGLPVSLLEAMSCGAIPVFPDFHDTCSSEVFPQSRQFLYNKAQLSSAVELIEHFEQSGQSARRLLLERIIDSMRPYQETDYVGEVKGLVGKIAPRKRKTKRPHFFSVVRYNRFYKNITATGRHRSSPL